MRKLIIIIIALITFSGVLSADYINGNELLALLEKERRDWESTAEWTKGLWYVAGVFDSYDKLLLIAG